MKYIKVLAYNEYSVFEVIEEYEKTIQCKLTNCENGYIVIGKNNVLAQADTIEELCDMTIVVDDERPVDVFELEWGIDKELLRKYNDVKGVYVYGAIWTNKGLIYVAKLNENGELELI